MVMGQRSAIELTFTAVNNTTHVQLDSIKVMNRTQGGKTILIWPDTVLEVLWVEVPESFSIADGFNLYQNYPNPFGDQTTIDLSIPDQGRVNLMVTDILGRTLFNRNMILTSGLHTLEFTSGEESLYFFLATWKGFRKSIKILHYGPGDDQRCTLTYLGSNSLEPERKSQASGKDFIISPGDTLLYIGYGVTLQSGILDTPEESETYTFQFTTSIPCPGTPTVNYEGQIYNTIQIFNQCWMKENLNVGTMIQGDLNMTDNGVIEKYCYGNVADSCNKYGGLYQWWEIMQYTIQQGVQGICPPGWHLPADEEWKVLEGTVDGQYRIGHDTWDDDGWRGLDAGTNLKTTSGWNENGNGTDLFGFSGLPGGYRSNFDIFYAVGYGGLWWTSTEWGYLGAWDRGSNYLGLGVHRVYTSGGSGCSVRCLRDY